MTNGLRSKSLKAVADRCSEMIGKRTKSYNLSPAQIEDLKIEKSLDVLLELIPDADPGKQRKPFRCPSPNHDDRNPSANLFRGRIGEWRLHCHSCGFGGDVLDVLQALHGLSFGESLRALNGGTLPTFHPDPRAEMRRRVKRLFERWCRDRALQLAGLLRKVDDAARAVETEADLEKIAHYYHQRSHWENELALLAESDITERLELFRRAVA